MIFLRKHKELIPSLAVIILLGIATYDLFYEQQNNSTILESGKIIDPAIISGRAACEVPIPDITTRKQSKLPAIKVKEISN